MSQQSRILLILAVFALGGVSALALLANRYAKALEGHGGTQPRSAPAVSRSSGPAAPEPRWKRDARNRALVQVDSFIAVRERIRAEIDRRGGELSGAADFTSARTRALAEAGMDPAAYTKVRGMFQTWRTGSLDSGDVMATAFEERREQLERLDLGSYEALDS
jgi:hypothetical protein